MQPSTLAEMLEQAASSLDHAAQKLRVIKTTLLGGHEAPLSFPQAEQDPEKALRGDPGEIAEKLAAFWHGVTLGPKLSVGPVTVDLSTAEGRWHLLVLAVLRGARVRERVVEETFAALIQRDLIDFGRLVRADHATKSRLLSVLSQTYRALGNREAKVEAFIANAAILQREYAGDLHNVYLAVQGEATPLIQSLQRFKQVGRVAYWICRTLKVHGIWPDVGAEATQFLDRSTDLPLQRLGIVDKDQEERSGRAALRFVVQHLRGDVTPLHLQGLVLCSQGEAAVCLSECPLASRCPFPQKGE